MLSHDQLLPNRMLEILLLAIQEQTTIGWSNVFRGYISKQWRILASSHMTNDLAPPQPMDGRRRLDVMLHRIKEFVHKMWTGRNETLHQSDKVDERLFQTNEAAEIRHYFTQPHLLPVYDQHYCTGSVLSVLKSSPASRRRWLMRVRRAGARLLNDQLRQVRITSYFSRKPHMPTPNALPTSANDAQDTCKYTERRVQINMRDASSVSRKRLSQSSLHHFFPGRPPDDLLAANETIHKTPASR